MKAKIDLHTHSEFSYDAAITLKQYEEVLDSGKLDYIAITDHDGIDFALEAQEKIGERIIVGEEVKTASGEVIGLFLEKLVPPGLDLVRTCELIKEQSALLYVPHPFSRPGYCIGTEGIRRIIGIIDVIEIYNGQDLPILTRRRKAHELAQDHKIGQACGSDAHHHKELGRVYTEIELEEEMSVEALKEALTQENLMIYKPARRYRIMPMINRLKRRFNVK